MDIGLSTNGLSTDEIIKDSNSVDNTGTQFLLEFLNMVEPGTTEYENVVSDIFNGNIKLVTTVLNREFHHIDDDAFQDGAIGLYEAIKRFDVTTGYQFSTYAYHYIKYYVMNSSGKRYVIRPPAWLRPILIKYGKLEAEGRSDEEIAKEIEHPIGKDIEKLKRLSKMFVVRSLEEYTSDKETNDDRSDSSRYLESEESLEDMVCDSIMLEEIEEAVKKSLDKLTESEKQVVVERIFNNKRFHEISKIMKKKNGEVGATRQAAHSTYNRALKKLKNLDLHQYYDGLSYSGGRK